MIKTELIDSKKYPPQNVIKDILDIILYNNRYIKSYLSLAKLISDDYHIKNVESLPPLCDFLFYKEYGIKLGRSKNFGVYESENLEIYKENTVYRAIMNNDKERFIIFTERCGFDKDQRLKSYLYPYPCYRYSLIELCCYYGAVDCFKFLRTKFNSAINKECLKFSFLGGNPDIMSECLKYQEPDKGCMEFAIISHNIDFVTFLMNEYNIEIDLYDCTNYKNLDSFLVYFDQTDDVNNCFVYSTIFKIESLCEYFLSHGADVNGKDIYGQATLQYAVSENSKEIVQLFISHGANINEKNESGETTLQIAASNNNKEIAELLISHGVNVNEKNVDGETALHTAVNFNCKEIVELLLSCGANVNEKDKYGNTALHKITQNACNETVQLLLSYGANVNEKDKHGETTLHKIAWDKYKEFADLLLSCGANVNEKDNREQTALHKAAKNNSKEIAELLISHGINIDDKDEDCKTALHIATQNNCKETTELLISHGAKI
ncbi:ankyrin repeat protein, putative [Trichomonas vaginalis G3]|uniref:Ankyrin repeat protein, putative n=1 Tax=Trichomonas vaginalis (strain ATCC PRA-98 / G3) TaxID=412133 RepID=A2DV31_TRIV3|nr:ankyrin repeat and SOCS box-containing protein 4 family [Trichomonas vaginalis G3]EAY15758.1 ankyrin repeat protein, putative [Trichomonas vaginalis G3]KAI5486532.1 ankyrin repeat and SOCS box-containing protein 4 family [Trichomonas vaginalis G3]|eukprot:XP_001327981.1 ankyrin repeat protein [Trichomonas vaginalis G3]